MNQTQPARTDDLYDVMQSVLIKGDLSKLTAVERVNYYNAVCKSIGLNPLTKPFDYIWLNNQLTLYARKDCTDQLRKIYHISVDLDPPQLKDNILSIKAHASLPEAEGGRKDADVGAVFFSDVVKGDQRANLIMKCVTKAKRRVTLSICGLGFLDETEVETIPTARIEEIPDGKNSQGGTPDKQGSGGQSPR